MGMQQMNKLELKHIIGYFNHNLKGDLVNDEYYEPVINGELFRLESGYTTKGKVSEPQVVVDNNEDDIEFFKPRLRPLSQLTETIVHKGEEFVPVVRMFKIAYSSIFGSEEVGSMGKIETLEEEGKAAVIAFENALGKVWRYGFSVEVDHGIWFSSDGDDLRINQFELIDKLNEWLFDWEYDLIGKGLAIPLDNK